MSTSTVCTRPWTLLNIGCQNKTHLYLLLLEAKLAFISKKKIAHYVPCLWNFIYASVNKSSTITKKNTCPESLTPACAWNHCDKPPSNTVSHHAYKNSLSETRVNVRFYQVFSCLYVHSQSFCLWIGGWYFEMWVSCSLDCLGTH